MSIQKLPVAGLSFQTEISYALIQRTGSTTPTPANGLVTVTTTAAHGLAAGQAVTFSGANPTYYNTRTFVVLSVPSTTTFVIATASTAAIVSFGTVIPIYIPGPGMWFCTTGANAAVYYNPDNTGYVEIGDLQVSANLTTAPTDTVPSPTPISASGATWRSLIAASSSGMFWSDGFCIQLQTTSSSGTTYLSRVE